MSKTLIVLLAQVVFLLAACASQPASQAKAKAEEADRHCLKETGSLIDREGCTGHGRSVSREELDRTGESGTGDALNKAIIR
jgi:hypothetical protein